MKKFAAKKDRTVFAVHVLRVHPWPVAAGAAVEVAWRRGARRGAARGVGAPVGADGLDLACRFSVPATLYRDPATGAHDKKWLTLELVRPSARGKPAPLARGVVDLAALAARVRAAGGAVRADLPLAAASGDVPPSARLEIEVGVEGGDARRSSSAGGGAENSVGGRGDETASAAAALAAAEAALAPSPPRRAVSPPPALDVQEADDGDASSDGELLAAAAAAADAADRAGAAAPPTASRHPSTAPPGSDLWASMNSSAIASAVASAMASDAGSPPPLRGGGGEGAPATNPFASADSEPGDAWANNPFGGAEEGAAGAADAAAAAGPPPPPAPTLPPLTVPPPPRHARTPSNELYLDGAAPLPGETGFGSVSATALAGRPRSGDRASAPDPIGDALEAAPPLDAIDLPPDAHDAAVAAGAVAPAPARSRPASASRFGREAAAASTAARPPRALLDETGAAIAANRRFARRAAGALAADGAASPSPPDSPAAGAARARAALAARSRFSSAVESAGVDAPPATLSPAADLEAELLTAAALEACVYLARPGVPSRPATAHAPARRLARTIVALGRGAGAEFGARALAAIAAAARAGGGGVAAAVRWWSAALQLRWMLWAMTTGASGDGGAEDDDEFGWAAAALAPPLRELEAALVARALGLLWHALVAAATAADPAAAPSGDGDDPSAAAEAAAARWLEALRAARGALDGTVGHAPPGHVALFRAIALGGLLERLDGALFGALVGGDGAAPADGAALPSATLPFNPATPLTFSTGVALKLMTSRLAHWAADAGVRDGAAPLAPPPRAPPGGDAGSPSAFTPPLFPRTRAAADLLMVPKEALADAAVRADVAPGLNTRAVAALLARYAPDASAPDPLPPGLLDALADEADDEEEEEEEEEEEPEPPRRRTAAGVFSRLRRSTSASTPRPRPRRSSQAGGGGSGSTRPAYTAPSEAALLAAGVVDAVALDQGAESDSELADLAAGAGAGGVRFDLLRALWASAR